MMTKEDYVAWRNHPITQVIMEATVEEADNVIADLVMTAGENSLQDKYRKGLIDGLKWWIECIPVVESEDEAEVDDANSEGPQASY